MARFDSSARFDAGERFDEAAPPPPPPPVDPYQPRKKKSMKKFKLDLTKKKPEEKITLGDSHQTAMATTELVAFFPVANRLPTDANFTLGLDDLIAAQAEVEARKTAWKLAISTRDQKEAAFDLLLEARANFCEAAQPNNDAALVGTGLPMRGAPQSVGPLSPPGNLAATAGDNEGEIELSCDPVAGANSYEWQCRLHTDAAQWEPAKPSTASKVTLGGLTPGQSYAFRVRGIGSAGPGPWSDETVKRAP